MLAGQVLEARAQVVARFHYLSWLKGLSAEDFTFYTTQCNWVPSASAGRFGPDLLSTNGFATKDGAEAQCSVDRSCGGYIERKTVSSSAQRNANSTSYRYFPVRQDDISIANWTPDPAGNDRLYYPTGCRTLAEVAQVAARQPSQSNTTNAPVISGTNASCWTNAPASGSYTGAYLDSAGSAQMTTAVEARAACDAKADCAAIVQTGGQFRLARRSGASNSDWKPFAGVGPQTAQYRTCGDGRVAVAGVFGRRAPTCVFHDGGRGKFSGEVVGSSAGWATLEEAQTACQDWDIQFRGGDGVLGRNGRFYVVSGARQSLMTAWQPLARGAELIYWNKCTADGTNMANADASRQPESGNNNNSENTANDDANDDGADEKPWPGVSWQTRFGVWHNLKAEEEADRIALVANTEVEGECDKSVSLPWDLKLLVPLVKWWWKGRPNARSDPSLPDPVADAAQRALYGKSDPVEAWLPDKAECRSK